MMSNEIRNSTSAAKASGSASTDVDAPGPAIKRDWCQPKVAKIRMEDTALMVGSVNDGEVATGPG